MDSKKSLLVIGACLAYAALWAWTFNDGRFLWLAPVFFTASPLFRLTEDYFWNPLQKRQIVAQGVTVRGFTVVDEKGNERIILGWAFADSGPRIELKDKEGDTRVQIAVEKNGIVSFELLPTKGYLRGVSLRVQEGRGDLSVDRVFSKVLDAKRTSSEYLRYKTVVPWPPDRWQPFSPTNPFAPDPFLSVKDEGESNDED